MFIPLAKVDLTKRLVYGTIAAEEIDHSGEILDYASAKAAFQKWSDDQFRASGGKSYGNVRSMHNRVAAGKIAEPLQFDDVNKTISACAYISDDAEWQKVLDGTHTGFSPGGGYAKRDKEGAHYRYTPVIIEVSLVDVPCQPSATFECIKADGTSELRKFKGADDLTDLEQGFRSKDGQFFKAKIAAKKWNDFLDDMKKVQDEYEAAMKEPSLEALRKAEEVVSKLEKDGGNPDDNEDDEDEEDEEDEAAKPAKKVRMIKAADHDLQKGFFNISRLAVIIEDLTWLLQACEYERAGENDASTVPTDLQAAIKCLITIITMMVAEEGAELGAGMADKTVDLPKEIAERMIKLIGADHAMAKQIKIIVPAVEQPDEKLMELNKALKSVTDELAVKDKTIGDLNTGLEKITKRLETIERQPMPPRGPLRAVDRHTERSPAPEMKKESTTGTDTLQMPTGLSPNDQRVWKQEQQRKIEQRRH